MSAIFTEDTYEQAIIELFENMGYEHLYAPDLERDYSSPLLDFALRDCLARINRGLPLEAIEEAIAKLRTFDMGSLLQKNMLFMDYLQNGITVKFFLNGEEQASIVRLIDYENVKNNTFYVVNQFTFLENGNNRRPDIILFINGLPLVLMELKSPAKDEVDAENAYNQIRNYMQDIPSMFIYNAMKIYRQILKMRPTWKEKIGVVMTGGNNDPEDWKEIIGTKAHKEELARKFKDNDDPMKIAIVVDMWLTGFDVPSLATMYIYKPMHGYNLMQAIARVNRVFKDKEGGLIVDYVGIASALKAAMKEYTKRDQSKYGDMNIAKVAYPKFQEKLQVCKDLLHGFDFSGFFGGTPLVMAKLITGGVNFVLDARAPHRKELFLKEAMLLKQANSLCSSLTTEQERHEAAYMEAVRSTVVKITYSGSGGKSLLIERN